MAMYQVAAFLRRELAGAEVVVKDFGALNCTWKEVADTLGTGFDAIVVQNDFDAASGLGRFVKYSRTLTSRSKLVTFGRLSARVPGFFARYRFDCVVVGGDPELAILSFLKSFPNDIKNRGVPGVYMPDQGISAGVGEWLDPERWALPNPLDIPHENYHRLYARDANKFCGIPGRAELVIPVARGCPVGCYFCEVPAREGLKDRRLPVSSVIKYAVEARDKFKYDYVSMYAPTFTLRRSWVRDLCEELISRGTPFLWKCTTTVAHLSPELIGLMGRAGCVRISVGLESSEEQAQAMLPSLKRTQIESVLELNSSCRKAGIELTCFVVLGMPGTSAREMYHSVLLMQEQGIRIRPTIYTDYSLLRADMSEAEVDSLNRQVQDIDCSEEDAQLLYDIYFGNVLRASLLAK